jgi:hypothetical protein
MRFRKLRIAWSVFWGLAAVLLIALWVRSYSWLDTLQFRLTRGPATCCIQCYVGRVAAFTFNEQAAPRWNLKSDPIIGKVASDLASLTARERFGSLRAQAQPGNSGVVIPFVAVVFAALTIAPASWLPRRFTLRTLLIATTLIAIVLGLIVWSMR